MKNTTLKDLINNNYYLIYGKNWIIIMKLIESSNGFCNILYIQHGESTIKSFKKDFLMHIDLTKHEVFELDDHEVNSQIVIECI